LNLDPTLRLFGHNQVIVAYNIMTLIWLLLHIGVLASS
jgi:hypothetical protein